MPDRSRGGTTTPAPADDLAAPDALTSLAGVARGLASALTTDEVLHRVADGALELTGARAVYVERVLADRARVRVEVALGEGAPEVGTEVAYPGSLTEEMLQSAFPLPLASLERVGAPIAPHLAGRCEGCAALVVPLRAQQEVLGAVVLLRPGDEGGFSDRDAVQGCTLGELASLSLSRVALQEETERERWERTALLNSTQEGLYGVDPEGRCTFVNPAASAMLGYAPEECLGQNMHRLIHARRPDGSPYPVEACPILATLRTGQAVRSEEVLWRKDGSGFLAQYGASPILEHGAIRGAVVFFSDIGERRRGEEALRRSEARYRALAEISSDAIVLLDQDSVILSANPAVERIFGYAADELVGGSFSRLIPERLRESHRRGMRRYVATGERHIPWSGLHLPGLRRDGSEVPLEIAFAEYEEDGRRVFAGYMRDITERVQAEEERERTLAREREARAEAERAVRMRDEVLGIVSHDLRNPLHTLMMSVSNLLDLPLGEEQRTRQFEIIQRSAQRMSRLIQDLLDVARLESGSFSVYLEPIDPLPVLHEACEAMRPLAEKKEQAFHCDLSPRLPPVRADRDRLHQVIGNLVGNAIKFTGEGGTIAVRAEHASGGVHFAVSDTGPGIEEQALAHLFDPYWQAKETAHLGAGLGLPISRGIVEAHGGRLWVESQPGVGSTFHFVIPEAPA